MKLSIPLSSSLSRNVKFGITETANKQKRNALVLWVRVRRLSYPPCKAHAQYGIVTTGLSGSAVFFHIIS
jgi:hypothetical protein